MAHPSSGAAARSAASADTVLIAPAEIGDGAYVAAGSTISGAVPPGALGVTRAQQRTVPGWTARKRAGTASDEAARRAQAEATDSE